MSMEITNNDIGSVVITKGRFRDDTFTAAAAKTYPAGTILARDSSTLKLIPYVKGGITNDNGIAKAVLTYDVVAAGAGDIPIRAMQNGELDASRFIIDADGDNTNVDIVEIEQLRDYMLVTVDVAQLSGYDNQ